jgi:hypothetical protein
MTKFTRRKLIRTLVGLVSYLPASVLLAAPTGKNAEDSESYRALGPYLDTLLPEDLTPSATRLGIDKVAIAQAGASKPFARLLTLGCAWLDAQAKEQGVQEFALLDPKARIAIVSQAEQAAMRSLPRAFFNQTRGFAFHHYYAHPASWKGLGYAGPPQPTGFPDHASPPSALVE